MSRVEEDFMQGFSDMEPRSGRTKSQEFDARAERSAQRGALGLESLVHAGNVFVDLLTVRLSAVMILWLLHVVFTIVLL